MLGYHGKILFVNLSDRSYDIQKIPEDIYKKYLGGYGLGSYFLYKHIKPGCDPLGPDNVIGFVPGFLSGTNALFGGRYMVCAKSPATGRGKRANGEQCTGGWGSANSGGTFGPALKKTGFDAIFITGQADKPVYLLLTPDKIAVEDAEFLWGKDTIEAENILAEIHGSKAAVASIGQAGENLSFMAGVCNDKGRMAARGGLGAVMGSKKLKALCLLGNSKMELADKTAFQAANKKYSRQFKAYRNDIATKIIAPKIEYMIPLMKLFNINLKIKGKMFMKHIAAGYGGVGHGTSSANVMSSQNGDTPVKNYAGIGYKDFPWQKAMQISGAKFMKYADKQYGCAACPLNCGYILKYDKFAHEDTETHRPEYETCGAFGALILNNDIDVIIQVNDLLNRAAMDSISAGATVAYVLEGVECGLFKKEDFICADYPQGFLPTWGDSSIIIPLVKMMIERQGIGDKLADGVKVASTYYPGAEEFAISFNGCEFGFHDMRYNIDNAVSAVADPNPGRHTTANYSMALRLTPFIEGLEKKYVKAELPFDRGFASAPFVKLIQSLESLGFCLFGLMVGRYPLLEIIESVSGWQMTLDELIEIGHRIQTTRQMFNAREGAIRHEANQRAIGSPPQKEGPLKGVSIDVESMCQGYYKAMGYQQNGVPTAETLNSLGLDNMIADLNICTGVPQKLVNEYLSAGASANNNDHVLYQGG